MITKFLKKFAFLLLLGCFAAPLRADLDSKLTVAVHALDASLASNIKSIKLGEIQDETASDENGSGQILRDHLQKILSQDGSIKLLADDATGLDQVPTLDGQYRSNQDSILLSLQIHDPSGMKLLWSRRVQLDATDFESSSPAPAVEGTSSLNGAASNADAGDASGSSVVPHLNGGESMGNLDSDEASAGDVIPHQPRSRRSIHHFHIDVSAGYKAFFPMNGNFINIAGARQDAFDLGVDFNDILLWDLDFWNAPVSNLGSVDSLSYAGTDLSLVLPIHLGPFTLYLGPSGRFGSIEVNDSNVNWGTTAFGSNAFAGVAGLKVRWDRVGADLRYSYDFTSSYTGFQTARLGVFYEFGH